MALKHSSGSTPRLGELRIPVTYTIKWQPKPPLRQLPQDAVRRRWPNNAEDGWQPANKAWKKGDHMMQMGCQDEGEMGPTRRTSGRDPE